MAEPLRSAVGQFSSSGGRWQPRAANVRAVEPAPDHPRADRGSLYVLIEVTGAGGSHAALYRQLLNAAQTAYYEVGEAVEVALRQAVREVQAILRRANEALPEAQLARRHDDGGSLRFAPRHRPGRARPAAHQSPQDRRHLSRKDRRVRPAARRSRASRSRSSTTPRIEHGSMVLLAQSDWAQQVKFEALAVAAAATSVNAATQYLGQLAGRADLSALLVAFTTTTSPR